MRRAALGKSSKQKPPRPARTPDQGAQGKQRDTQGTSRAQQGSEGPTAGPGGRHSEVGRLRVQIRPQGQGELPARVGGLVGFPAEAGQGSRTLAERTLKKAPGHKRRLPADRAPGQTEDAQEDAGDLKGHKTQAGKEQASRVTPS